MKYAWIEDYRDLFSVTRMCRQLGVSRTGYCQWRTRPASERSMANAALDAQVAAIHAGSKRSYGRPRIVRDLRKQGTPVSHERVRNSLKRQGLRPVYKRPYRVTTDSAHKKPIAPHVLNRRFDGWQATLCALLKYRLPLHVMRTGSLATTIERLSILVSTSKLGGHHLRLTRLTLVEGRHRTLTWRQGLCRLSKRAVDVGQCAEI